MRTSQNGYDSRNVLQVLRVVVFSIRVRSGISSVSDVFDVSDGVDCSEGFGDLAHSSKFDSDFVAVWAGNMDL
jgi:hypothetical protein